MSLSSRSPLFDNRQVCPAIAHEGPWEALNILGRVNQRPTDSDAPQSESVQKVVTLMGMFDTVWIRCPKCGAEVGFQIKAGDCPGNHGYNNNDVPFCPKCLQVRVAELERENARLRQANRDCYARSDALNIDHQKALKSLDELARLGNGNAYGNSIGNEIAQQCLNSCIG